MSSSLEQYVDAVTKLHVNRRAGHLSPHKPVMLLAVLSLADNGVLLENRIEYGPELLELFREYFNIVRTPEDRCTPRLPYLHLNGDKFWHHQPRTETAMECVTLDHDLFALLLDRTSREVLRIAIVDRYFAQHRDSLLQLSQQENEIGLYREHIENTSSKSQVKESRRNDFEENARCTGFRRAVTSAYDYRCAACGSRVILGDLMMVDAAHLIPFSESHDDDPCNGMALCKNHHWAMDRFLIGPWPDGKWHVHRELDDRLEGQQDLLKLDRRSILLPTKSKFHPREDALEWRKQKMKECA